MQEDAGALDPAQRLPVGYVRSLNAPFLGAEPDQIPLPRPTLGWRYVRLSFEPFFLLRERKILRGYAPVLIAVFR